MDFHRMARAVSGRLRGILRDEQRQLARRAAQMGLVPPDRVAEVLDEIEKDESARVGDILARRGIGSAEDLQRLRDLTGPDDGSGARWGKYSRLEKAGEGASGTVWKAWDSIVGRWVALKLFEKGDARTKARFLREAHASARLSHPGIAQIYEVGELEGTPYLAMQFIEGRRLDEERLDVHDAVEAVRDAAEAVHFAHEHGILHRDLKPQNMMRAPDGRIYLLDFGLAKEIAFDGTFSTSGTALGTPAYMPPEQAEGRLHAVSVRSDVYSLGATLHHLVAGAPPFDGRSAMEVVQNVIHREPVPSRQLNRDVSADLEAVILKALEKDPARRYDSARALAEDLTRLLRGEPVRARPASALYRLQKRVRRNPIASAAVTAALACLIVGAAALVERHRALGRELRVVRATALHDRAASLASEAVFDASKKDADLTLARREMDEAVSLVDQAVEQAPDGARARSWRATLLLSRAVFRIHAEDYAGAIPDASRVIEMGTDREKTEAYSVRAYARRRIGDPRGAVKDYTAAIERGAQAPQIWFHRGISYSQMNRPEEAARDFQRCVGLTPGNDDAWENLGISLVQCGRLSEALVALDRAIEIKPANAEAHAIRGWARVGMHEPGRALADLERALLLDPGLAAKVFPHIEEAKKQLEISREY